MSKLAKAQHGIVTRRQLLYYEVTRGEIESLIKKNLLIQVRGGIYRLSTTPVTWHQSALLAINLAGKNSLLSHESVLVLYGILDFSRDNYYIKNRCDYTRDLIHVTNLNRKYRDKQIYIHRSKIILPNDLNKTYKHIPHTSIERSIVDCSQQLSDTELSYSVERILQLKLATPNSFVETLDALPAGPGREKDRISKLIEDISRDNDTKHVESILEKRTERLLKKHVKYPIKKQYEVKIQSHKFRLDFAIPQLKIAIEVDGYQYHAHRSAFDADRNRSSLLAIAGWKVLHITAKMSDAQIISLIVGMQNSVDAS